MTEYAFHHVADGSVGALVARRCLASDAQACVHAFDLLRGRPDHQAIVVVCEGRQILLRTRNGGKIEARWAKGYPRRPAPEVGLGVDRRSARA